MTLTTLSVGHYGHALLKGAKHWSFLLHTIDTHAIAYQITGSTNTYEFMEPEEVDILGSQTYLGKVDVGNVDTAKLADFLLVLNSVPIVRGDLNWNCQNWIVEALKALSDNGFAVDVLTKDELASKLALVKRNGW